MPKHKPRRKRRPPMRSLHKEAQEAVGQAVWLCRRKSGVTQTDLAEAAGLDVKTIYHLEKGSRPATIASLASVASALDVSMQQLVPGYVLGGLRDE